VQLLIFGWGLLNFNKLNCRTGIDFLNCYYILEHCISRFCFGALGLPHLLSFQKPEKQPKKTLSLKKKTKKQTTDQKKHKPQHSLPPEKTGIRNL